MGFMTKDQVFLAMTLVTAIDLVGGVLSFQDRLWLGVVLAIMFVPLDCLVVYTVSQYTNTDHPSPDYSIKQ